MSGRPGQAIAPYVTGTNIFQIQSGLDYGEIEIATEEFKASNFNTVMRYGISEYFEINGAINYAWQEITSESDTVNQDGISQSEFGVRTNIVNSDNFFPSIGFQYRLKFPSPTKVFATNKLTSVIILVTDQKIGNFGLVTNWGIDWFGDAGENIGFYVINLSTSVSSKLGVFVEHYGFWTNGFWLGKFDGGFAFLANDDLQLDLYGGWGSVGEDEDSFFASVGVSWRTKRKKK